MELYWIWEARERAQLYGLRDLTSSLRMLEVIQEALADFIAERSAFMLISRQGHGEVSGTVKVCQAAAAIVVDHELHPVASADAAIFRPTGQEVGWVAGIVQEEAQIIAVET